MRKGHDASAVSLAPQTPAHPQSHQANAPSSHPASCHTPAILTDAAAAGGGASSLAAVLKTPSRKGVIQHRQITSPTTYAIAFTAPDARLLERIKFLASASNKKLAQEVQHVIFSIYYTLLERRGEATSVGILGALITERRDQKAIHDQPHNVKAASFFNAIHKVIPRLKTYIDAASNDQNRSILVEYHEYLLLQAGSIQAELKQLPEKKKSKAKAAVKKDLQRLLDQSPPPKTPKQRELAQLYHAEALPQTPSRFTPRSQTVRAKAAGIAHEIDEIVKGNIRTPKLEQASPAPKRKTKALTVTARKRKIEMDFVLPPTAADAGADGARVAAAAAMSAGNADVNAPASSAVEAAAGAGASAAEKMLTAAAAEAKAVEVLAVATLSDAPKRAAISFTLSGKKTPAQSLLAKAAAASGSFVDELRLSKMSSLFQKVKQAKQEDVQDPKRRKFDDKLEKIQAEIVAEAAAEGIEMTLPPKAPGK